MTVPSVAVPGGAVPSKGQARHPPLPHQTCCHTFIPRADAANKASSRSAAARLRAGAGAAGGTPIQLQLLTVTRCCGLRQVSDWRRVSGRRPTATRSRRLLPSSRSYGNTYEEEAAGVAAMPPGTGRASRAAAQAPVAACPDIAGVDCTHVEASRPLPSCLLLQ